MKRIIVLCLAIIVFLSFFVGCDQQNIRSDENSSECCQDSENTHEEKTDGTSEQQENDESIDNSIQTKQYQYFYRSVEENPYDKWLKNELEKGERAEKTIYAEYLAFWKDELAFTIECGEVIFNDKEQY